MYVYDIQSSKKSNIDREANYSLEQDEKRHETELLPHTEHIVRT